MSLFCYPSELESRKIYALLEHFFFTSKEEFIFVCFIIYKQKLVINK